MFFDQPYDLDQYRSLLETTGLKFADGQVEFFPRTNKALRLPFGHKPLGGAEPYAWLSFVRRWERGKIKRHSLAELYERVDAQHAAGPSPPRPPRENSKEKLPPIQVRCGIPRRYRRPTADTRGLQPHDRYLQLVEDGPISADDVAELFDLGICVKGTRVEARAFYPIESPMNCSGCPYGLQCRDWQGTSQHEPLSHRAANTDKEVAAC